MKNSSYYLISFALIFTLVVFSAQDVSAQTNEFTFQGSLKNGVLPANGSHDFEFALFDAIAGGTQLGSTITMTNVAVTEGVFSVQLNFGSQFPGASRFLEIRLRQTGGGTFTPLTPRQSVTSAPYSIKSLNADTATNATNATTAATATNAVNFSGALSGDVTGTQASTVVTRLQGRDVSGTAPLGGQVLKFNSTTNRWVPDTDIVGTGGGGGTITGVIAGAGLTGGGTSGTVILGIAEDGVGTSQIVNGSVTDAKIISVSGSKVTGTVASASSAANATNAATATNANALGGIVPSQYLQVNGAGTQLTGLNASNIAIGTLSNARLGVVPIANGGTGSATQNFVDLTNAQTVGGNKTFSGTLSGNAVNTVTEYRIGGQGVLSGGATNIFGGGNAGSTNSGSSNSFFGGNAGSTSSTGSGNSFFGNSAGNANTTGNFNTAIGSTADVATGNLFNATAVGARAFVSQANSLVLGSIAGINSAVANANVGIGTTAPTATLTVFSTANTVGDNTATFQNTTIGPFQSHVHYGTQGSWFIRSAASSGRVILQDTGGNVGIGTTTPNSKLQVTGGSIYVSNPNSLIITSPNGACWFITVGNTGTLSTISVTCP